MPSVLVSVFPTHPLTTFLRLFISKQPPGAIFQSAAMFTYNIAEKEN